MADHILVIDEGTTSTRAMLFDASGAVIASAQAELTQSYPGPGLVEHDAGEIWDKVLETCRAVIAEAGGTASIAAIGITNQRETVVFWDRETGVPLAPAIVWQDRRTADICRQLKARGEEPGVQALSGLLLDPYFSGSKIGWALEAWPQLREAGRRLAVGTVESYLVHRLTGGLHISDATNASRTALMAIGSGGWDDGLCDLFRVPRRLLPEIVDSAGSFGETLPELFGRAIPICGLAGDQQAASIGQRCLAPGDTKATYGTGAFVLTHTGKTLPRSRHRLLGTIAWQFGGTRDYALEGSVFVAGSLVKWLRDSLRLIDNAAETEGLARSVADNGGCFLVPALSGLGAPYWEPGAQGVIAGLGFATGRAHVVRAALESMAHQTNDLKAAFAADGFDWTTLRIDGGMAANDWIAQDLADMLDVPVERPAFIETTAVGAAMLAGLGCGLFDKLEAAATMRGAVDEFRPVADASARETRLAGWRKAVTAAIG